MTTHYERDEAVAPGLRYTEEHRHAASGLPVRDCSLWLTGVERPVSALAPFRLPPKALVVSKLSRNSAAKGMCACSWNRRSPALPLACRSFCF